MSQNTLVIADGTGAQVLERMNNANNTLVTLNSGSSAPATTYAYMLWADTANDLLKIRNAANTGWVTMGTLSATNLGIKPSDGDKGDITVSSSGNTWTIDNGAIGTDKLANAAVTPAKLARPLTFVDYKTASGPVLDFTNIPSWVTRVTLNMWGAESSGTSTRIVRLGGSTGGVKTTGYSGSMDAIGTTVAPHFISNGFDWSDVTAATTDSVHGTFTFTKYLSSGGVTNDVWIATLNASNASGTSKLYIGSGAVSIGGTLNLIRITSINGTDNIYGNYSIIYE